MRLRHLYQLKKGAFKGPFLFRNNFRSCDFLIFSAQALLVLRCKYIVYLIIHNPCHGAVI